MSYVIALTGAQGTGKSTLAHQIAALLISKYKLCVQLNQGIGESASSAGFSLGANACADAVRFFADAHRRRESSINGQITVLDRCLLDALAYASVLDCLPSAEFARLKADTSTATGRLDRIIWLKVTHDYPVLGPFDETPIFRRAIDTAIGRFADEMGIRLHGVEIWCDEDARIVNESVMRDLAHLDRREERGN